MSRRPRNWLLIALAGAVGLYVFSRTTKGAAVFDKAFSRISKLIAGEEGLRLEPYRDPGAGAWTIGYGHLIVPGDPYWPEGTLRQITAEQARDLFKSDTQKAVDAVQTLVRVPLNSNQFAALVSLVFNIGRTAFAGSTLLRKLNAGDYPGASGEFPKWKYDNGILIRGLLVRRQREQSLFNTPEARA